MRSQSWKNLERTVARKLSGKRVVTKGIGGEDVEHERFAIECKYRQTFAFIKWFKQALGYGDKSGKIPILVCKQARDHGEYVIVRLDDFVEIVNGL